MLTLCERLIKKIRLPILFCGSIHNANVDFGGRAC